MKRKLVFSNCRVSGFSLFFFRPAVNTFKVFSAAGVAANLVAGLVAEFVAELTVGFSADLAAERLKEAFP